MAVEDSEIILERVMQALTEDEKEIAARSSYKYLQQSMNGDCTNRDAAARSFAQHYLDSKKCPEKALRNLRETLTFRQEHDLDALRLCCGNEELLRKHEPKMNAEHYSDLRNKLQFSLGKKEVLVQGHDVDGRALWIAVGRSTRHVEPISYIRDAVYTMERAIACSETRGQDQVTAIINYSGYNMFKHNPSLSVSKQLVHILRRHYVGRLYRIYMVDAPSPMRALWNVLKPLAGRATREKIVFVSGPNEKKSILGSVVHVSQAAPWMLPPATGQHCQAAARAAEPFAVDRYLDELAFDQTYQQLENHD